MTQVIDLRSDTVTRPTEAMRAFMMQAPLGDDVFTEDPSINELEAVAANFFERQAAIFCPSGTMTNQIAIKLHTAPADEVICDAQSHIYLYEGGGIAANSGCQVKLINGDRGRITAGDVEAAINPDDIHKPISRLVSLENTCNRGGGSCYDYTELQAIRNICTRHNLALHLDGARLFNALVATGKTAAEYGQIFDTISICLSKGLGAPVGSLLIGNQEHISKARRIRKRLGGGMRQAGMLAAAGTFALKNNITRLAIDHAHAQKVAELLATKDFVGEIMPVETNIVIFEVKGRFTAEALVTAFGDQHILAFAIAPTRIRFVFHLDITAAMIEQLLQAINDL